jgi:transcriptional regulator with XRE-family HTH domain
MVGDWRSFVRRYRLRHGLSQVDMAHLMGVAQRTISRWERGEDSPSVAQQKRLRDLGWEPASSLFRGIADSIPVCPVPRALTRTASLRLHRTTITYFFHEGTLYNDAIGVPAPADAVCGYWAVPMDEAILSR